MVSVGVRGRCQLSDRPFRALQPRIGRFLLGEGVARRGSELAAEVAKLEADDVDRAELTAVAQLMESLRAPG